ncbi:MAG: N-6 DNA methylase [Hespellia sp.]|nr:N-6 DNA methylase [Hespellia sp.]
MDLGQVFTNRNVAKYMVSMFELEKNALILDPCFGAGAFLTASMLQGFTNVEGYEIDKELYKIVKMKFPKLNLYNNDFLEAPNTKKYDGIIMNPPYIRQEKINDLKILGITKTKLRKNKIYEQLPSTANMYMYFIFKALDLLKDDGELVVIFPSSWMDARSGKIFQKALNSCATIIKQVHISGEVFEKSALVEVVILKLKKTSVRCKSEIVFLQTRDDSMCEVIKMADYEDLEFEIPFSKYASVRRGLTTGYNAMYINPIFKKEDSKKYLVSIISSPKSIVGYGTKGADVDNLLYIQDSENIPSEVKKHIKKWEKVIRNTKTPKTLYKRMQKNDNWYKINLVDGKGIVFSYFVRNDMKFIMNNLGCLIRDNFYIIIPRVDEYLMMALLNNYFTYYQLEKSGKKYGAGLLKLQRYDIEALKFPDIRLFSSDDKVELVNFAKDLVDTGNKDNIIKITEIMAKYSGESLEMIKNMYEKIRKFRLEGKV